MRILTGLCAALGLATMRADAGAAAQYSLINLGSMTPTGINSSGEISGSVPENNINTQAALWSGGSIYLLGRPANAGFTVGNAINDAGQVTGEALFQPAFLWAPAVPNGTSGVMTSLGDINAQGSEREPAHAINNPGQAVGEGFDFKGGGYRGFLYKPTTPNGTTGSLTDLGKGNLGEYGINNVGEVVGQYAGAAFLWNPTTPNGTSGAMSGLGTLPGGTSYTDPAAINAGGAIVGQAGIGSTGHAFLWTPTTIDGTTGSMVDLGTLSGGRDESRALALNSLGAVVGESGGLFSGNDSASSAYVWTASSGMVDLNTLVDSSAAGWTLQSAVGVNDLGWIVGTASYDPDGPGGVSAVNRGFVLVPSPEPGGAAVLVIAGALFRRRGRPAG